MNIDQHLSLTEQQRKFLNAVKLLTPEEQTALLYDIEETVRDKNRKDAERLKGYSQNLKAANDS